MVAVIFDTLEFVETLKESGFNEEQAKGMATAIKKVQQTHLESLATKADFRELKSDLCALESCMMGELRLVKWMLALVIATTVLPAMKTLFGL